MHLLQIDRKIWVQSLGVKVAAVGLWPALLYVIYEMIFLAGC